MRRFSRSILTAALFFSGFSGLAYELLWVRGLAPTVGSATQSFALVLALFFGGLALGSAYMSRIVQALKSPLKTYIQIELWIAAAGFLLAWLLPELPSILGSSALGSVLGAFVLLPPTFLMGMTLPVMTRALFERGVHEESVAARAYAWNTLGAASAAVLVTWFWMPRFGVFKSTALTMAMNLVAVLLAWSVHRLNEPSLVAPAPSAAPETRTKSVGQGALVIAFLSGFSFILFEVVWSRVFGTVLRGTTYAVGSVLVAVLIGIAVGGFWARQMLGSLSREALLQRIAAAFLGMIVFTALLFGGLLEVVYALHTLKAMLPSVEPIWIELVSLSFLLAVPSLCAGVAFPLLVEWARGGRSHEAPVRLGRLYASNTFGSIAGSLIAGFVLIPFLGSETAVLVGFLSVFLALIGVVLMMEEARDRQKSALALVIALGVLSFFDGYDREALNFAHSTLNADFSGFKRALESTREKIRFFAEGKSANVAVVEHNEYHRSLSLAGLGQGGVDRKPGAPLILESFLVGFVPYAHVAETPHMRGMVVGLGAGVTVESLRRLGAESIDVFELEPEVLAAQKVLYPEGRAPHEYPGVKVHLRDARKALLEAPEQKWDLIASMPAHPWIASPIFTKEFFELARDHLTERGVFSTWFGIAGMMDQTSIESLVHAFTQVFPSYGIYKIDEVGALYLVGSKAPSIEWDTKALERVQVRGAEISGQWFVAEPSFLMRRLIATGDATTPRPGEGTVLNTDDHSIVEFRAPLRIEKDFSDAFVPESYLHASHIRGAVGLERVARLIEEHLGTPDGVLPVFSRRKNTSEAQQLLDGHRAVFSQDLNAYFEARLTLDRKPGDRAAGDVLRSLWESDDSEVALRSRRFWYLSFEPGSKERQEALTLLPQDPTLNRLLQDEFKKGGKPGARVVVLSPFEIERLTAAFLNGDRDGAVPPLMVFSQIESPSLLERCIAEAERRDLGDVKRACESGLTRARLRTAAPAIQAALKARDSGDRVRALALLKYVQNLAPNITAIEGALRELEE